jgi:hypothetical protein
MNSFLSNRQALSQSYPDNYFAPKPTQNPAFTGATEVETLGYNLYGAYRDSVYHLEYTFDHIDPNLVLDFIVSVHGVPMGLLRSTNTSSSGLNWKIPVDRTPTLGFRSN